MITTKALNIVVRKLAEQRRGRATSRLNKRPDRTVYLLAAEDGSLIVTEAATPSPLRIYPYKN